MAILDYQTRVSRSDVRGLVLRLQVSGPARVTRLRMELVGGGSLETTFVAPDDGRSVTAFGAIPPFLGTFELLAHVEDERGCIGQTGVRRFVTVVP